MASLTNITDAAQLAAIADQNRMAILRLLMAEPATLTQLAAALGSYAARVRHHVKRLEEVGLVRLARRVATRNYTEKYYEATAAAYTVHLILTPKRGASDPLVILHCDTAIEVLAGLAAAEDRNPCYSTLATGSLDGLVALRQGLADVAGCHLLDADTQEYNTSFVRHLFPGRPMAMVTVAYREQGLVVRPGNPKGIRDVPDLARAGVKLVNREPGSGTRTWLDSRLKEVGLEGSDLGGFDHVVRTHEGVAHAVESGTADSGIVPRATALAAELDFVPLFTERYDLVFDQGRISDPRIQRLMDVLVTESFRRLVDASRGYDTARTGDMMTIT